MDKILEAVMQSSYPMYVKQSLARRVIEASKQPMDSEQCWSMLELSTKLFFLGESRFARETAREVLEVYGRYHPEEFEEFFNVRFILNLLQEGYGSLGKRHAFILDYIHLGLQFVVDKPTTGEIFRLLRVEVLRIVCERPSLKICVRISKLLTSYSQCIPTGQHQVLFCQQLIRCLGQFHCHSEDEEGVIQFLDQVNRVSGLLQNIWRLETSLILPSLKEVFAVISSTDELETPSNSLASVVQYIPLELMEGVVRNLANADSVTDAQMMTAINRMIDWVSWPLGKNIDKWIIALLKGLAAVKKFSILTEVSLAKIQKVFSKLLYPVVREGALSVLRYMLLSYQHSPEAFHLIVPPLPQVVFSLSNENTNSAASCLEQLAELVHCMVFRFSGYPDLYEPIMEAIKKLPVPNEDRIKQLLGQNAWTSQKNELAPYYPRLVSKSDTGKIGLINLGNTCYMNSILQALFMASDFRHSVLCLRDSSSQPLMMKLQHLFAFLEHSQRPAVSPESFLACSWPPWFTPGVQQDCSEYLKYLLDRLHEEEKTGKRISQTLAQASSSLQSKKTLLGNRTLVEQMFGGRIVTKIRCLKCQCVSAREEAFTDLSLAFPPSDSTKKKPPQTSNSSSPPVEDIGPYDVQTKPKAHTAQTTDFLDHARWQQKIEEKRGKIVPPEALKLHGKDASKDKDENNCMVVGIRNLSTANSFETADIRKCSLTLSDLINHFLCPEMLTADNKYRCETCLSLQDAEKIVELSTGPQYLILTLLRFSFDLKAMKRRKILDNVSIPMILKLPIHVPSSPRPGNACLERGSSYASVKVHQSATYDLCTVIVHSGLSSESGHYYCYSRECMDTESHKAPNADMKRFPPDKHLDMEIQWYLFNDTRVTFSSFESVSNITSFFPKDTAYVLFYRHRPHDFPEEAHDLEAARPHSDISLNKELMEAITKDNIKYLQEQEKEARNTAAYISPLLKSPLWWQDFDKDNDDDGSPGGLGPAAGGASGSFHGLVF
ncbi:PREDICTED: ubiquitin carboxyl-terminal hydrolase 35 [Nanorana parkeri]|uniref:ubiquitin carboxyl-terminal hydrolase 35 n=1 Tax=Nanorana parkeri TaxID=125878 RepID=UPI0008541F69|nr:PREDICTED: ubiquitin carboxyl-terminal hydrolase 35 [Nanorana parkeri]